jgi:hypothetical protein
MSDGDNSKPADDVGQVIRRLPTGLYELSPSLPRPQPTLQSRQPPRRGVTLFVVGRRWKNVTLLLVASTTIAVAGFVTFSIERRDDDRVTEPVAPTQILNSTLPMVDAASAPPRSDAPEARSDPLPVIAATAEASVQAPLRSRSPDDTGGVNERGADRSVANVEAGPSEPAAPELRSAPTGQVKAAKRRPDAHHAARRGTIKSARRKTHDRSFWDMFFPPLSFRY